VTDHCSAIELILERGQSGCVYNVGGRAERANIDIVGMLCAFADEYFAKDGALRARFPNSPCAAGRSAATLVSYVTDRPGHDRRYAIDCARIERELGFVPQTSIERGLKDTFAWFLANEEWWRAIMDGRYRAWVNMRYGAERTREGAL
jgi:dTDP-glucose 4,6-dehydratase